MFYYLNDDGAKPLYWWEDEIQPYVKNYQIVVCPSAAPPQVYTWNRALSGYTYPTGFPVNLNWSYAVNAVTDPPSGTQIPPFGNTSTALAAIEDVATTIDVVDAGVYNVKEITVWSRTDIGTSPSATECPGVGCFAKRHLDGGNVLFCDGHVKWLKETKANMWTTKSD